MLKKMLEQMKKPHGDRDGGKVSTEKRGVEGTSPEVEMIRPSKQVGTGTKVLFAPADAKLTPEAMHALDEIATLIAGHTNIYMVKGHTSANDYPDGSDDSLKMNLSLRRAQVAADYLVSKGVARVTLRVQGCSTYEPVAQHAYTDPEQSLNRPRRGRIHRHPGQGIAGQHQGQRRIAAGHTEPHAKVEVEH